MAYLELENVCVHFPVRGTWGSTGEWVRAVDGVSLSVEKGEVLGLVGESGCGKSTLSRAMMQLQPVTSGRIVLNGTELTALGEAEVRKRRLDFQMVFQDPYASLNPRFSIFTTLEEALSRRAPLPRGQREAAVAELMERVGLSPEHMYKYPHEFSGGQRQRIAIARAIAPQPALLLADEPVSALDVSIQAQVINLLNELRHELGLTILFIAHDLSVVKYFSDRIGVMYYGKLVEVANGSDLYAHPLHPYTKALLSAIPEPNPITERTRVRIEYNPAEWHKYPMGQNSLKASVKQAEYAGEHPEMREIEPGHFIYCDSEEFAKYQQMIKE